MEWVRACRSECPVTSEGFKYDSLNNILGLGAHLGVVTDLSLGAPSTARVNKLTCNLVWRLRIQNPGIIL